jgi:hypothetical protein
MNKQSSLQSQRRKAPNPANAIKPAHASESNPSIERRLVAAEALVAAVLEALVVELATLEVEEPLEVALAGRLESVVSAVSTADNPVTFVQDEGAAMVPATKFTAAHLAKSAAYYQCALNEWDTW